MRRSKYGAVRTTVDGITFASKKEAKRYSELKLLERAGEIGTIALQQGYDIIVCGNKICRYVSDFAYRTKDGEQVVEDVKGVRTSTYRLKAKLMQAIYGITIKET